MTTTTIPNFTDDEQPVIDLFRATFGADVPLTSLPPWDSFTNMHEAPWHLIHAWSELQERINPLGDEPCHFDPRRTVRYDPDREWWFHLDGRACWHHGAFKPGYDLRDPSNLDDLATTQSRFNALFASQIVDEPEAKFYDSFGDLLGTVWVDGTEVQIKTWGPNEHRRNRYITAQFPEGHTERSVHGLINTLPAMWEILYGGPKGAGIDVKITGADAFVTADRQDDEFIRRNWLEYDLYDGPRVGDWVDFPSGEQYRISHIWRGENDEMLNNAVQTSKGGSFHLGHGYCSFSGGLFTGIPGSALTLTDEKRPGSAWMFHHNHQRARNGIYFQVPFRVFTSSQEAPTS